VANDDGKNVLGVATGHSEAETFWTDFLRSLADRGIRGVKLVIADDHKGLRAAACPVFNATHQRCRIHWMRNALGHAPATHRTAVAAMLKTIFALQTKVEAEAQSEIVADALRGEAAQARRPDECFARRNAGLDVLSPRTPDPDREHTPPGTVEPRGEAGRRREACPRTRSDLSHNLRGF